MNSVFFSIVIPTYNSAGTLSAALESILQQDYQHYEILIIDGCSKDATLQIATEYNDPRIKILSEPDKGVYDAMNKGIARATGEWLYFLGSDDRLYTNDVLAKIATACTEDINVDAIYGNVYRAGFDSLYDGLFDIHKIYKRNICHQALFVKKSVFTKFGNFKTQYKVLADWDHNMRWFLSPHIKHRFVNEVIANFEAGGVSSTHSDIIFRKDKLINYLRYSKGKLTIAEKLPLIKRELIVRIRERDIRQVVRLLSRLPGTIL